MSDRKIISLLPAATETLCALGLKNQLVGRSHECDYPPEVKALPSCSSSKIDSSADSQVIDHQVKALLADALSVYDVDKERIRRLNPDVLITQTQCDVCAVSENDVQQALNDFLSKDIQLISLHPNTLEDVFNSISTLAEILGAAEKGEQLLENLQERVALIKHKLKFMEGKPRVACIEWLSPLMTAGNWTPELIGIGGGIPVLSENGVHSSYIEPEALSAANPDVILLAPCGFSIGRTLQEIHHLSALPGWEGLNAVKNNQVYLIDGNQYVNRPGPRIVDSIELIAEILYPKQFAFGYEGEGWTKFDFQV